MQLANSTGHARSEEVGHQINILTLEMSLMREGALIKSGFECFVVGMAKEVMKLTSLGSALDLFLGKVSVFTRNTERKYSGVVRTRNFGGNGGCMRKFPRHQVGGEDPGVVRLDGAGT